MPEISIDHVTVERTPRDGPPRRLLDDVSLTFPKGFVGSLIGPSGAGKTTALRLMNRMIDPTRGELRADGKPMSAWPVAALRRRVAMVFSEPHLLGRTVEENLRLIDPGADAAQCAGRLEDAGLREEFLTRRESELSAGERHRVSLARALMAAPEMILLDEVTSSLDPRAATRIIETLRRLHAERHLSILLASHVFDHVRALGGECAVLIGGRVVEQGPTEAIFSNAQEEATRRYLKGTDTEDGHD